MKWTTLLASFMAFLCIGLKLSAQNAIPPIDLDVTNETLPAVLKKIESLAPVHFYYKEGDLPNQTYSRTLNDVQIEAALDDLLGNTLLGYLKYRDHSYIIMPKTVINEVYTINYYQALQELQRKSENDDSNVMKLQVGEASSINPSGKATVSGMVTEAETGDPVIGATIKLDNLGTGTTTEADGSFSMEAPVGEHILVIQYIGYDEVRANLSVYNSGSLDLTLNKSAIQLDEVTVRAQAADASVEEVQVGIARLDVKNIERVPTVMGEADVIKNLLLFPGVTSVGEGTLGFNVRGGDVDQNLIVQDEGFLFNSSHALGFFSTFNSNLISSVELYKGNMPASYGGRIASVLDVTMRDGNMEQFKMKGSIGPISSRLSLETPIVKDKVSILGGIRASYVNWLLKTIKQPNIHNTSTFFYDGNVRLTAKLGNRNTLIASAYGTQDEFYYNNDFGFDYGTKMGQVILKSILSDKVYTKLAVVASDYYSSQFDLGGLDAAELTNRIAYQKAKAQVSYVANRQLQLDAGLEGILYKVDPSTRAPYGNESEIVPQQLESEKGLETAAFVNGEWSLSSNVLVSGGLRFAYYSFLGPKTVYEYENPEHPSLLSLIDSTYYDGGSIASYTSLEPRLSFRFKIDEASSVKAGYSRTGQFINQIFNTDSPTPNSQWQLSNTYIKPVRSHNVSVGYFHNFKKNTWETSLELYGRYVDQLFDYRDFAELNTNPHLETEILSGVGRSYGAEVSIKKNRGEWNGWLSYTYSRSLRMIDGINKGNWYPSNFDKPHDATLVLNYQPNQRNTFTFNFNYGTGRPNNAPIGIYKLPDGQTVQVYSERNQFRIPDYHRLDISYTIGQGYRKDRKVRT
ncbi:MAG: TonB-dependent receptor, partial [Saprospiraceae bacterium]|nr:TonB-dependent receptor [Saprospiraceae bacterium]